MFTGYILFPTQGFNLVYRHKPFAGREAGSQSITTALKGVACKILKKAVEPAALPTRDTRLKIDYGSQHTGFAVLSGEKVLLFGILDHRTDVKKNLDGRRGHRRFRRTN